MLPIFDVLPAILTTLKKENRLVLQAPPGAGKTTALPLKFLDQSWMGTGKILMLEPRRIAARNAAWRMASTLGEKTGKRVGYSVHLDKKVSDQTRIEVVTEGVFLNRLLKDPELPGVSLVIFDEFHERSLDADLSLALVKETQEYLREELKILVMSATLDAGPVASYLDGAPIITSEGTSYPVEVKYEDRMSPFQAVVDALHKEKGSFLVFLPGAGEIRRLESDLKDKELEDVIICPLYGALSREEQEKAIEPAPEGLRKIVLATNIAESSITIKGIRVVIDCGLQRRPRYNPRTAMDSLETVRVSQASADQRTGRAGRLEPGISYRLWPAYEKLEPYSEAAIEIEDLSKLTLTLAQWGYDHYDKLPWLTKPREDFFQQCRSMLQNIGAIGSEGITELGRKMNGLPLHPRLASMVLKGKTWSVWKEAADLAALLSEKDILSYKPQDYQSDIHYRLEALEGKKAWAGRTDRQAMRRIKEYSRSICSEKETDKRDMTGSLLIAAYPDRIGKNRGDCTFQLSNGSNAAIGECDTLSHSPYVVIPALGGTGKVPRVFLAASVSDKEIEEVLGDSLEWLECLDFDKKRKKLTASRQLKLGHLTLKESKNVQIPQEKLIEALLLYLQSDGLGELNWSKEATRFRQRVNFLHTMEVEGYPLLSDENLVENLKWLKPYLSGFSLKSSLQDIPLLDALKGKLPWELINQMETLAPTHLIVPSGSRIPIDYSESQPFLKVRLQEMFGLSETPLLCRGKCPLLIHLLSPASRPIQITKDLKNFWENTYGEVKKDLMGRYPKHYWPENPLEAQATNRVKNKLNLP